MPSEFQHLFSSFGEWIAFRRGKYVYDTSCEWIGWLPWNDQDVVDASGEYLGTIWSGDRLYRFDSHPFRGYPDSPGYPGYPGYPGDPGFAGYAPLPADASDIADLEDA